MGVKFGMEEGTFGGAKNPQNRPLSKLNTGRFALRAMLLVIMTIFLSGRQHTACSTVQLLQRSRLIQHLGEKCDFRVSSFCQVVQKHKLFEVAY